MNDYILQVTDLKTYFKLDTGTLKAVDDVTFHLKRNETIGIIGESGCGKSVTAHSILRTVQNAGKFCMTTETARLIWWAILLTARQ